MAVYILGASGCVSQGITQDPSSAGDSALDPTERGNIWSEQDVTSMFSKVKQADWEYIDCKLMPDHASGRIGAVLFWNAQEGTSNVAFFDADGYFQQCGTYEKPSDQPDFTYLGDGAVTFQLKTENGTIRQCTITISIHDSNVYFKVEDGSLTQ